MLTIFDRMNNLNANDSIKEIIEKSNKKKDEINNSIEFIKVQSKKIKVLYKVLFIYKKDDLLNYFIRFPEIEKFKTSLIKTTEDYCEAINLVSKYKFDLVIIDSTLFDDFQKKRLQLELNKHKSLNLIIGENTSYIIKNSIIFDSLSNINFYSMLEQKEKYQEQN